LTTLFNEQPNSEKTLLNKLPSVEEHEALLQKRIATKEQTEEKLQAIANNVSLLIDEQEKLDQQFKANMSAFEEHFPDINHFFKDYSPQKNHLIIHEHYANVIEDTTGKLMYDYPAYLMALAQVKAFEKSPLSSTSKFHLHDEKHGDFLHSQKLNPIISILQNRVDSNIDKTTQLPKHINALVMFGIGLGFHLELLVKQHSAGSVYLIEPDLDTFYASLFTADWPNILKTLDEKGGNLHISLGPQEDEFFDDLLKETYLNGRYEVAKTYLYIHYNTPDITKLVTQYKSRFFEMIQGWGFFDDGIMAMSHFLASLKMGVPLVKKNVPFDLDIATTPVFIVGNGPSLDEHIDFIKQHHKKVIIISCASALSALYKCGVDIDFHCEQERIFAVAEKIDFYAPKEYIKKQTLLAPATVHPEVYKKFARAIMAPKASEPSTSLLLQDEEGKNLFEEAKNITPTVANTALVMATKLGFRKFYFLGVDLGYRKSGAHHSQHSFYYDDSGEDIDLYPEMEYEFINKGNFSGTFISDSIFNMSRLFLEKCVKENPQISCFNLSDGVYVEGLKPLKSTELTPILENAVEFDKADLVDKAYNLAAYFDHGELYQRLDEKMDIEGFAELCEWLIDSIDEEISSEKSAIDMLRKQSHIIREVELSGKRHLSLLINGSVLHIQAMLVRLLHEAEDESIALTDFKAGLALYREFLVEAPGVFKQHYKDPMYRETAHLDALRKAN